MSENSFQVRGEASRARLMSLLSEACELEHALACAYLYSAFSIKREISEGIDWQQQQTNRLWASQIYHVAAQEMLHLAQAWNLLTAVGGTPYFARPNFPQPAKCYPLNVALQLRRCDVKTMEGFVYFESPAHQRPDLPDEEMPEGAAWSIDESFEYRSVGELYGECLAIVNSLDEKDLFVGSADRQISEMHIDFPEIVEVTDRDSARAAIHMITDQGEGNVEDWEDSHYGIFKSIHGALANLPSNVEVARPVGDNPYVRLRRDQMLMYQPDLVASQLKSTEITNPLAILAMDLFDDAYVSMLQAISYVFSNATHEDEILREFAESSLQLMTTVIKPLGEAICLMPSGEPGINAGPAFAFSRHTQLPAPPATARLVYLERLQQLAVHANALVGRTDEIPEFARSQLKSVSTNLNRISFGELGRHQRV